MKLPEVFKQVMFKWTPRILGWGAVLGCAGAGGYAFWKHSKELPVAKAIASVAKKVDLLSKTDQENHQLRQELLALKTKEEEGQFACKQKEEHAQTEHASHELEHKTGSPVGRTLSSITYKVPTQYTPKQLYSLSFYQLQQGEYEQSVAVIQKLLSQESSKEFRTPQGLLSAAVGWYHLDHYAQAGQLLNDLLKTHGGKEIEPYHARARLLKALIAKQQRQPSEAQHWLKELRENHPRAPEFAWVNNEATEHKEKTHEPEPAAHRVPAEHEHEAPAHTPAHHEEKHQEEAHHAEHAPHH